MRFSSFLSLTAVGLIAVSAQGAAVSWDGGASTSSWHDANNWNPNGVPGAGDQVTIGVAGAPGTSYAVNVTSSVIMDSITLNASSSVNITGGGAEAVFQVDGGTSSVLNPLTVIELEDINATLLFSTASQSITGGGTIQLDDVGALLEIGSGLTLTSDVVVQGYGSLAAESGTATFINQEVVTANSSGNTLELFSDVTLDDIAGAYWKAEGGGKIQFKHEQTAGVGGTLLGHVSLIAGSSVNNSTLEFVQSVTFSDASMLFTWNSTSSESSTLIVAPNKTFTYQGFSGSNCGNPDASGPPYAVLGGNGGFSQTCNPA